VTEGVAAELRKVRVGDPFDPTTQIGSLISRKQFDRVTGYIDKGVREGAELVTGGARLGDTGFFLEPALFAGRNDLTIAQEEIFGPVGLVVPFDDYDEAIRLATPATCPRRTAPPRRSRRAWCGSTAAPASRPPRCRSAA
jgi:acyl-CoA reductase-like NAD-dependent aldehyde dehydrogenase